MYKRQIHRKSKVLPRQGDVSVDKPVAIVSEAVHNDLRHLDGLASGVPDQAMGGIFFLFSNVYQGDIKALLAVILSANSIAELIISAILTATIIPALEKAKI